MNIAEQVIRAKQDLDDVYSAGQSSMVDESKLIPKTVSGSYISVDDVSEIPHGVACKVESVNLLNPDALNPVGQYHGIKVSYSKEEDCFIFNGSANSVSETSCETRINIPVNIGENITLSTEYVSGTIVQGDGCVFIAAGNNPSYGSNWMNAHFNTTSKTATKAAEAGYITRVWFYLYNNPIFENYKVKIQLKKGNALPYTPYVKPEEVEVTRTGKNLCPEEVESGYYWDNGGAPTGANALYVRVKPFAVSPSTTYAVSSNLSIYRIWYFGNGIGIKSVAGSGLSGNRFTTPENCDELRISFYNTSGAADTVAFEYAQVEIGKTITQYEPYNGQTLTPSTDGTVEGMTSVSPYMNVFSDTEGVNIEVEYNKSYGMQTEWDRFWDAMQDYGKREQYEKLFAGKGWTDETFNPKYDIVLKGGWNSEIFKYSGITDLVACLERNNVVLDTSQGTALTSMFQFAVTKRIPTIDVSKAGTSITTLFQENYAVVEIEKVIFASDGSQPNVSPTSMFGYCQKLESITIGGVIGYSISFQYSPLNKASITSIINALSPTATGQTLTLKLSAVNTAFETSTGAADGSTSAEFAALVATKTNWTITMI